MLFCCVKFSISQLFCCVKFKYHLSSRKWQAQLCLIQWVLCELMLLDMSYLCKFFMDYIGSLVQLKQLQLDRLAFRLHMFLAFDMSLVFGVIWVHVLLVLYSPVVLITCLCLSFAIQTCGLFRLSIFLSSWFLDRSCFDQFEFFDTGDSFFCPFALTQWQIQCVFFFLLR